jgi:tetratricopeptide (TPR) repeat protein
MIVGITLFACTSVVGAQSATYKQGMAAYEAHQYSQAASLLATAPQEGAPGETDAMLYRAMALIHLSRLPEAESALHAYLNHHPDSFEALVALGAVQQQEDKPRDSIQSFNQAAQLHTPSPADLRVVALDYVLLNDYTDAIHWLKKTVEFDRNNGQAWYDLGRCYYTQNLFKDAQNALERANTLLPNNVKVLENLGLTLDAENLPSEAEAQYRKAVDLARRSAGSVEPDRQTPVARSDEWPYLNYGTFLISQDRAADAVPQLKSAVAANPKCAQCHLLLGRALAATGNLAAGVHELEQAVSLDPSDPKVHYQLARLYRQAGDRTRARQEFALTAKLSHNTAAEHAP